MLNSWKLLKHVWNIKSINMKESWSKYLFQMTQDELNNLYVIYNPDCGCPIDQFVLLDRYPMSTKIICECPSCKKACIMVITDPIEFHYNLNNEDYSLKDLLEIVVRESNQSDLIHKYQELAKKTYGLID